MRTPRETKNATADFINARYGCDISDLSSWDKCKGRVLPRLVDYRETDYLQGKPHTMTADLPVIYSVEIGQDETGTASAPVTDSMLAVWGITLEELDKVARKNIKADVLSLAETLAQLTGGMAGDLFGAPEVVVLSNKSHVNGAAAVLDPDTMGALCKKFGGKVAMIPSSIHEWLVMSAEDADAQEFGRMIKDVNATALQEDDILSDRLYTYSPEEGLQIA